MFYNRYGLLNANTDQDTCENMLLYSVENLVITRSLGYNDDNLDNSIFDFIEKCKIKKGLYHQRPKTDNNGSPEDMTSHDQITAMICYSISNNLDLHKEIWAEILHQKFRYDNLNPENPSWSRLLHPRDIIFYGAMAGNIICKLLLPLLFVIQYISSYQVYKYRHGNPKTCSGHVFRQIKESESICDKCGYMRFKKTDGKILAHLRNLAAGWNLQNKICEYIMKNRGFESFGYCYKLYFPEGHPNRKLLGV